MRRNRQDTQASRQKIVTAAARLFSERGYDKVTVADITAEAGLTHGGFYGHFPSKIALAFAAAQAGFAEKLTFLNSSEDDVLARYLEGYLTLEHVQTPAGGCPIAAFSLDAQREGAEFRSAVSTGAKATIDSIAQNLPQNGNQRAEAIRLISSALGALMLARATADDELAADITATIQSDLREKLKRG